MSDKSESEFVVLPLNELIINNDGKTGIPFEILRNVFGFSVMVKGSQVYIKNESEKVESDSNKYIRKEGSTDNFLEDFKILKEKFSFQEYYQGSLIYSSNLRGVKHYDVLITENSTWCNITLRGGYRNYCDLSSDKNIIIPLMKFYFPNDYEKIVRDILEKETVRYKCDERDVLIRKDYDGDTKEIVFSQLGGSL
ncbi:hypothetical protein [Clostridium sp. UBA1056]|uniref:hypothetical protein n=1 Tax=unclassified Clostridium TaxID=2614128 RepID=UPI003217A63D